MIILPFSLCIWHGSEHCTTLSKSQWSGSSSRWNKSIRNLFLLTDMQSFSITNFPSEQSTFFIQRWLLTNEIPWINKKSRAITASGLHPFKLFLILLNCRLPFVLFYIYISKETEYTCQNIVKLYHITLKNSAMLIYLLPQFTKSNSVLFKIDRTCCEKSSSTKTIIHQSTPLLDGSLFIGASLWFQLLEHTFGNTSQTFLLSRMATLTNDKLY